MNEEALPQQQQAYQKEESTIKNIRRDYEEIENKKQS